MHSARTVTQGRLSRETSSYSVRWKDLYFKYESSTGTLVLLLLRKIVSNLLHQSNIAGPQERDVVNKQQR